MKVGNPYLRPQYTRSFELAYRHVWDEGSFSTAVYHRDIDDPFTRVFATDPTGVDYDIVDKIYQNVGGATNAGVEFIAAQDVGDWLELSGSLNLYRNTFDAFETTLLYPVPRPFQINASEDTTWDLRLTSQMALPAGFDAQLSYLYYAPRNVAQGTEDARSSVDVGLTKSLFDDRVELAVSATDIFNQFGISQAIDGDGFTAIYENFYQTQVINIGLTYNF